VLDQTVEVFQAEGTGVSVTGHSETTLAEFRKALPHITARTLVALPRPLRCRLAMLLVADKNDEVVS